MRFDYTRFVDLPIATCSEAAYGVTDRAQEIDERLGREATIMGLGIAFLAHCKAHGQSPKEAIVACRNVLLTSYHQMPRELLALLAHVRDIDEVGV